MGLGSVWIGEDIEGPQDIFTLTGLVLSKTKSLRVGIGITSPYIRNITTIARGARTLAELGEGRFVLGLGVGGLRDLARRSITPDKPLQTLEDAIHLLRKIWGGETVHHQNDTVHLANYSLATPIKDWIPIYLGGRGPGVLKLAGRLADGVILNGPHTYLEGALEMVERARRQEGIDRCETTVWLTLAPPDPAGDGGLAKKFTARILRDLTPQVLRMARLDPVLAAEILEADSWRGLGEASKLVPDGLVEEFLVTPRTAGGLLRRFEGQGVGEVIFGPPMGEGWWEVFTGVVESFAGGAE